MESAEIKTEVERLKTLKEEAYDLWIHYKSEHTRLGEQIYNTIDSCTVRSGEKHAGGGGGLGGRLWVICEGCGFKHFWNARDPVETAEWKALPGKVKYHSTGN
jgi:hypothetical protein